jgi:hypothetical protein
VYRKGDETVGIRINKVIGYGLDDVVTENGAISDPRINPDSPLLTGIDEDGDDYWTFLERIAEAGDETAQHELLLMKMLTDREADTRWLVTHQAEYGLPNVLVVRPVGFPDWHRHDDPIDYQEEVLREDHPDPRAVRPLGGLYPFNGLHMDVRTGERIEGTMVNTWRRAASSTSEDEENRLAVLDLLARGFGYADHAEAERFVAPLVPHEVRHVCAWGKLFTSKEVCFQLRPLIYTYWA